MPRKPRKSIMCTETEYDKVCNYAEKIKARSIIKAILQAIEKAEKPQPASNVIPSQPETPNFTELPECDFMTLLLNEKDHILCDDRKVLKAYCKTRNHRIINNEGHSRCFPKGHIALKPLTTPRTRSTRSRNPYTNFTMGNNEGIDILGHKREDRCL